MMDFYSGPAIKNHLYDGGQKIILLVGGFAGYLNFGDVVQLQGAIQIHQRADPEGIILPVIHPSAFQNGLKPEVLEKLFSVAGWIFYAKNPSEQIIFQDEQFQSLVPVDLGAVPGDVLVHFYGSGRLNEYWGEDTLRLLEIILTSISRVEYIMSGQQVSPSFIQDIERHLKKWKPLLIGCRDEHSVESLTSLGINAAYSGDDAFEILQGHSSSLVNKNLGEYSLGINIRRSGFAGNDTAPTVLPEGLMDQLKDLYDDISPHQPILAIRTFGYSREQGISIENYLEMEGQFSIGTEIDLVKALVEKKLSDLSHILKNLNCAVVMSYHLAFFLRILQVPVYMVALNDYYAQKQAGLGQSGTLSGYFNDLDSLINEGRIWLERQAAGRQKWLYTLDERLSK
jgi:hypothetical protein